jgi:DNA-binding response OmpR family regulator
MERRGEAVSREELSDCLATAGKKSDSNKTEVYLCYLRRKLEKPTGRRWITTVRGVGYRLEWE